jgi:hypothetical protein
MYTLYTPKNIKKIILENDEEIEVECPIRY